MKTAVFDTYVPTSKGSVLHFDIIVPENQKDTRQIYQYGKSYLRTIQEPDAPLSTAECQFCHLETPTDEMRRSIEKQGYYILEMEEIPATLPPDAGRRELILHLRGHYPAYRFADFRGKNPEELRDLLEKLKTGTDYQPVERSFYAVLAERAQRKAYCQVQFFTELRELTTVHSVINRIFSREDGEWLSLVSAEQVRLDRVISVDGIVSPAYPDFMDFTCDC